MNYKKNINATPCVIKHDGNLLNLDINLFYNAMINYSAYIEKFYSSKLDLARILGMRNLSATIGELFVQSMQDAFDGILIKNPHQDGYPDLLLMDDYGKRIYNELLKNNRLQEKAPFSPFAAGGIEVKATCGSVPDQKKCNKMHISRPDIGDQRISVLKGYDWKAHHRQTNNLVGIIWDFIDGLPTITSLQYSNLLTTDHWGEIVQPRTGGGRTTSVSIMTRAGVAEMYAGWLFVIDDSRYINFFNTYNNGNLM